MQRALSVTVLRPAARRATPRAPVRGLAGIDADCDGADSCVVTTEAALRRIGGATAGGYAGTRIDATQGASGDGTDELVLGSSTGGAAYGGTGGCDTNREGYDDFMALTSWYGHAYPFEGPISGALRAPADADRTSSDDAGTDAGAVWVFGGAGL